VPDSFFLHLFPDHCCGHLPILSLTRLCA